MLRKLLYQPIRRAILYVPGDNKKHTEKALNLRFVDCIVFDCEDGVAKSRKEIARHSIKILFENRIQKLNFENCDWAVRVNSVNSGHLPDDLNVLFDGSNQNVIPKTLFLPKVNNIDDLKQFSCLLSTSLKNSKIKPINLIIYSESCESILNLQNICQYANSLEKCRPNFVLSGIVFGSDDFLADLGATRDVEDSSNILYARQKIVLTAKAFGLQAIDMVYINFKDTDGLKIQSLEGAKLGYTGKQTIHPNQVKIVQDAFMPSKEEVEWAQECLNAFKSHQQLGKGAFVFRNQMIDNPTVEQAKNILKLFKNFE